MTTNYGYGTGNDLLTTLSVAGTTTQTIGYTGDGNMANFSPGIQAPAGATITTLGWNQNQRLSAVKAGSDTLVTYGYDGFGQRGFKTISTTNVTLYQYGQDGMLLEETNSKGVAQADYIYLNGRLIATLTSSGTLDFLHDDLLGAPQLATDSGQNIAWQARYQPFGGTSSVSGAITQNLRLPGQYYDLESGWNHNGFRNYFPDLGRYAEQDPLAMPGTTTHFDPQTGRLLSDAPLRLFAGTGKFYAYVGNDPINLIDPLGLKACKNATKNCLQRGLQALFPSAIATVSDATAEVGGHWNFNVQLQFASYNNVMSFYNSYWGPNGSALNGFSPPARFGNGPAVHLENLSPTDTWLNSNGTYTVDGTAHIDLFNPNNDDVVSVGGHVGVDGLIGHLAQALGGNIDPAHCPW